ncbi:MAG: NifX-associated nitrogen fixation protein [Chromatiaceae bacterium]|nr:MAG: NifX-associated nitrogen fixation protein [Chromatiaceae bacterium]
MTTDTVTAIIATDDPILETDFIREVIRQVRALDTYGTRESEPDAQLLEQLILTAEQRREIPIVGDPDAGAIARLHVFYNALAMMIERECGLLASPMMSLNREGFGRVIIAVGKLIVVDKSLRDVHRFGFDSLSKMKNEADKLLSVALNIIGDHPKVAGL